MSITHFDRKYVTKLSRTLSRNKLQRLSLSSYSGFGNCDKYDLTFCHCVFEYLTEKTEIQNESNIHLYLIEEPKPETWNICKV